jgi:hypothetical protein
LDLTAHQLTLQLESSWRAADELKRSLSRAWLRAEYRDKERLVGDIARELEADYTSLTKLCVEWSIGRHPPDHVPPPCIDKSPLTSIAMTLSPAMRRIRTHPNPAQALRSALLVPGYPPRREQAVILGLPGASFNTHLYMLEALLQASPCSTIACTQGDTSRPSAP